MVNKQFKFKLQIQKIMQEDFQKKEQKKKPSQDQERQNNQDQKELLDLRTPDKRQQQQNQEDLLDKMEPFPLPLKINIHSTAASNENNTSGTCANDMKVIQTPCIHRYPIFQIVQIQGDDLRPITGKLIWENTPGKANSESSDEEQSSSIIESEEMVRSQTSAKQSIEESQMQQQENPQKPQYMSNQEQIKPTPAKLQRERSLSKRLSYSKKNIQYTVPQPNSTSVGKKIFCNCKKTKCLKLYCDCFRINQTCEGCNCVGCHNLEEYSDQRNNAIVALMDRNPDPFSQKINDDKHLKGCNCKKSFCLKKYCQCYQAGLRCGENCKCDECKNGGGSQKRQQDRQERQDRDKNLDREISNQIFGR